MPSKLNRRKVEILLSQSCKLKGFRSFHFVINYGTWTVRHFNRFDRRPCGWEKCRTSGKTLLYLDRKSDPWQRSDSWEAIVVSAQRKPGHCSYYKRSLVNEANKILVLKLIMRNIIMVLSRNNLQFIDVCNLAHVMFKLTDFFDVSKLC